MNIPSDFMIGSVDSFSAQGTHNNAEIDQEGFLKIMAASISNPSMSGEEGGSQTDYLNQLTQFNMLDQLTDLTETIQTTLLMTQQQQALSLVGKEVTVAGAEDGLATGTVEKVRFSNGYATIQVDGVDYGLNSILEVGETNYDAAD